MTDTVDKVVIQAESQGVQQTTDQLNKLGQSMDGVAVASQNVEKSTTSVLGKFQGLERGFNTAEGAAAKFAKVQDTVNKAVAQNPELQQRGNDIIAAAQVRYLGAASAADKLAQSHAGLSGQAQALQHFFRSTVDSLASGAPVTQVLGQEFGRLSYVMSGQGGLSGAFNDLKGTFGGMLTPMRLVAGGVAGLAAGALYLGNSWDEASSEVNRALAGIGRATGTTAADIANFTKQNATAAGLSVSEARQAALELTKTGEVSIASLHGVGDAIKGYSLLTGTDATDSTKAFASAVSGDLLKGIMGLDKAYGSLGATQIEQIRTLSEQGNKNAALQVFIDATAAANKRAEESVSTLTKAWQGFKNVVSTITTGPAPRPLEQQISDAQKELDNARSAKPGGTVFAGGTSLGVDAAGQKVQDLQAKLDSLNAEKAKAELDKISKAAFQDVNAIIPQIQAISDLNKAINEINEAKSKGVAPTGSEDALAVAQHQLALQEQARDAAINQAQVVNQIQAAYGGVSVQTALTLNNLQAQLNVAQQVTAAGQMRAQAEATITNLITQGTSELEAQKIAAAQLAVSQAAATTSVEKQVKSLKDQTDMMKAQQNGTEATTAGAIAYNNAIESGASATSAAALQAQTLAYYTAQAASNGQELADAMNQYVSTGGLVSKGGIAGLQAQNAADNTGGAPQPTGPIKSTFDPVEFAGFSSSGELGTNRNFNEMLRNMAADQSNTNIQQSVDQSYIAGGIDAAKAAIGAFASSTGADPALASSLASKGYDLVSILGKQQSTVSDKISAFDRLVQLENAGTTNPGARASNNKSEIDFLNTLPKSVERDQKIADLTSSIQQLTSSTNSLTSVNQDLLSPYYTQDPRTSHIGFRSQGMATGGEITVPGGYSANDNMLAQIPVASGEIVSVRRPGQNLGGNSQQINMGDIHITVQGGGGQVNPNVIGRTVFQFMQQQAKQLARASR
jgi:phage-related minor tail protein